MTNVTDTLPEGTKTVKSQVETQKTTVLELPQLPTLAEVEREYILRALKAVGGNKALAAKVLGLSVKTVYNKLHAYGTLKTTTQG